MSRAPALAALVAAAFALSPRPAGAHELRPGSLEIAAAGNGRYEVTYFPAADTDKTQIVFPAGCARDAGGEAGRRFLLDCGPRGLAGQPISVTGLAPLTGEVLVRLRLAGGAEQTALLSAASPSVVIPEEAAGRGAAVTLKSYSIAGAEHLITGLDHVLFVLGLLLLVRGRGALVRAVTAFTVAHSLTLALQALGAVKLPPAPVEAAIALSVLLLAREVLRPAAEPTWTARRPWAAAFAFGLLHGLGFAGGLASFHLPRGSIAAALLGFNFGLEAAQLGLIAVALVLARALRPLAARAPAWARPLPAYGIGAAAAFWLLQRTAAFWS